MPRVSEGGAVEVVVARVDTQEGGGEDDEALLLFRAGERVGVVSAQSPGPEPGRSTLIFHLQIFPVNRTSQLSALHQRRN